MYKKVITILSENPLLIFVLGIFFLFIAYNNFGGTYAGVNTNFLCLIFGIWLFLITFTRFLPIYQNRLISNSNIFWCLVVSLLGIYSFNANAFSQQIAAFLPTPTPVITPTPALDYREVVNNDNILIKINEARLAQGLPQLKVDDELVAYANIRASEINASSDLTHETKFNSKDYLTHFSEYGEILFSGGNTSSDIVNGWLASPTHKDLMLSSGYDTLGVSTLTDNVTLGNIAVVEFGKTYVPQAAPRYIPPPPPFIVPPLQLQPITVPPIRQPVTCHSYQNYFGDITTSCY